MDSAFVTQVRQLEEKLFADLLDSTDVMRMKSDKYSWLYRPSHHFVSGLLTEEDVTLLKEGGTLLSVGAHPGYLEQVLVALGVPAENMMIADNDPDILQAAGGMPALQFDMHDEWPLADTFDRIIFPESLCIALTDKMKEEGIVADRKNPSATDAREAELLSNVIKQALAHLKPNGVIRANGPMSHPNVIKRVEEILKTTEYSCEVTYKRFLIEIRYV